MNCSFTAKFSTVNKLQTFQMYLKNAINKNYFKKTGSPQII